MMFFRHYCLLILPVAIASPVPVIDLGLWLSNSSSSSEVVSQVKVACETVGFFGVTNHGVEPRILQDAMNESMAFFDLPLSSKLQHKSKDEKVYPYGYEQSEQLALGYNNDSIPDLKETFQFGPNNPDSGMPARQSFPSKPLRIALEAYYEEMEGLARTLLELFAVALDLPMHWFDPHLTHHQSALRILNYAPNTSQAGPHTDYGALTILKAGGPGLQIYQNQTTWINGPSEDVLIINIGDLMQRWTNDQWVSTLHRVIPGPKRRQSIAYFVNINGDSIVSPLTPSTKYPPIRASDHLMAKHLRSMGVHDEL
jgi:isopenicillin N synthase-like dioxygenase